MRAMCELANTFCVSTANICHAVLHPCSASISCFQHVSYDMEDATVTDSQLHLCNAIDSLGTAPLHVSHTCRGSFMHRLQA